MTLVSKGGGFTNRHWFKHSTTNEMYDVLVGSQEETDLTADGDYATVTEYETTSKSATLTPTDMPDTVE